MVANEFDSLHLQKYRHPQLDSFMGVLATLVSTEFYALVLPVLFWVRFSMISKVLFCYACLAYIFLFLPSHHNEYLLTGLSVEELSPTVQKYIF